MSEVQKDPENVSAGIGQKIIYKVLYKFSCNLRSKLARSNLTSPGPIRVNSNRPLPLLSRCCYCLIPTDHSFSSAGVVIA
jgi:hypothetical protein